MEKIPKRVYTKEFKEEAPQLVLWTCSVLDLPRLGGQFIDSLCVLFPPDLIYRIP